MMGCFEKDKNAIGKRVIDWCVCVCVRESERERERKKKERGEKGTLYIFFKDFFLRGKANNKYMVVVLFFFFISFSKTDVSHPFVFWLQTLLSFFVFSFSFPSDTRFFQLPKKSFCFVEIVKEIVFCSSFIFFFFIFFTATASYFFFVHLV